VFSGVLVGFVEVKTVQSSLDVQAARKLLENG
jgi:hypothetical protein